MLTAQQFKISAHDGSQLHVNYWPSESARACIYLCHGMSEHGARYGAFAEYLNSHDVSLICMDQRGFGESLLEGRYGYFAREQGWQKLLADHAQLHQWLSGKHPGLPIFLMGHSMGSYVAQSYLLLQSRHFAGLILSASNLNNRGLLRLGVAVSYLEALLGGWETPSKRLDALSFGRFNTAFEPARTDFDWLSRDDEQVDLYIGDPLCGGPCSPRLWRDFLSGLLALKPAALSDLSSSLPMLLFAGQRDPAGGSLGMRRLAQALNPKNQENIELKIYADGRHEMLNESNRSEVFADVLDWLCRRLDDSV